MREALILSHQVLLSAGDGNCGREGLLSLTHSPPTLQGLQTSMSQDLVGLWADEYGPAIALLRRIFPPGLMRYLSFPRSSPVPVPSLKQVNLSPPVIAPQP